MLTVSFFEVREGQIDQVPAWSRELTRRTDEVQKTYRQEGMSHEVSYLIEGKRGWILVFAAELTKLSREGPRSLPSIEVADRHRASSCHGGDPNGAFDAGLLYGCHQ